METWNPCHPPCKKTRSHNQETESDVRYTFTTTPAESANQWQRRTEGNGTCK
jgi:hypothetical protein